MRKKQLIEQITKKTKEYRRQIIEVAYCAGKTHIGATLSCLDIVSTLYLGILRLYPKKPRHAARDRFILSKGHGCLALYSLLAEKGYLKKDGQYRQYSYMY